MEIIHIILGKANPNRMNGVNKVVYQLATHQAACGKDVAVWGITDSVEHNYGERNFRTELFQAYRNPFKIDSALKAALISKKDKVVVHLHGGWIPTYASLSKFLSKQNIPFVITAHGAYNTVAMKRSNSIKKLYFALFEKALLTAAYRVHCIGESEVTGLNSIFPNNKSFLLPYGFSATQNEPIIKQTTTEYVIGFVGRLDVYTKGLDLIVAAFKHIEKSIPEARLWIVGDGPGREELTNLINEAMLSHKIILWGSKFGAEKDNLVSKMDVFVHPSRNEGLPASVLEAANMGIPSVVSRATNVASFIEKYKAGLAIADESTDQLIAAIHQMHYIWKKGNIHSYQLNAQKMVREAFDWNKIVNDFDKLYA